MNAARLDLDRSVQTSWGDLIARLSRIVVLLVAIVSALSPLERTVSSGPGTASTQHTSAYRLVLAGVSSNPPEPSLRPACATLARGPAPETGYIEAVAGTDPVRLRQLVDDAVNLYHAEGITYDDQFQDYRPDGDYLNYGIILQYERDTTLRFEALGLPLVEYDGVYLYNPVTIAQYALTMHGRYMRGNGTLERFLEVAEAFRGMQGSDGAFRYSFPYTYYRTGETFLPGWTSAMTQGVSLSVFARAYSLSGLPEFQDAAEASLTFMVEPANGMIHTLGTLDPGLSDMISFEEYPSATPSYTLNGFGYTLFGLYDWQHLGPEESPSSILSGYLYDCGLASFITTLPYHNLDGFSTYDLDHLILGGEPNLQAGYHALHIGLLHAFASISPDSSLREYEARWRQYVD